MHIVYFRWIWGQCFKVCVPSLMITKLGLHPTAAVVVCVFWVANKCMSDAFLTPTVTMESTTTDQYPRKTVLVIEKILNVILGLLLMRTHRSVSKIRMILWILMPFLSSALLEAFTTVQRVTASFLETPVMVDGTTSTTLPSLHALSSESCFTPSSPSSLSSSES